MVRGRSAALLVAIVGTLVAATVGWGSAGAETEPVFNEPAPPSSGDLQYHTQRIGPITLDAEGGPHWQENWTGAVEKPDIDVPGVPYWALKSITFDLVDGDGNPLPRAADPQRDGGHGGHGDGIHLHHFVFASVGVTDPACPDRTVQGYKVQPHLATGAERTPLALPDPYALKFFDSQTWAATWHFMNMTDQEQTFYLEYTIGYDPDADNENTRFVVPWFLDVTTDESVDPDYCGFAEYDVPAGGAPGSIHEKTRTWTIPYEGVIVGTGGHVHSGGYATELRDGDGNLICRSVPFYQDGHAPSHGYPIDKIEPCPTHYAIDAGEELTLVSQYDGEWGWEGAMGINLTLIWPGDQLNGLSTFPDVTPEHPFFREVAWGVDEGITTGYGDGQFWPGRDVTRQAFVAFLHRMMGSPTGGVPDPGFADVPPTHPFYDAIAWAAAEGLVQGYKDGTFRPGGLVTRQATVAFLHRLAGAPEGPFGGPVFWDVESGHPFEDEIQWGAEQGLVNGYDDGTFRAGEPVTRQAAMAFLFRQAGWNLLRDLQAAWDAAFG